MNQPGRGPEEVLAGKVGASDLYHRLQVSPQADADTIRRAYRKLAMKYHPDKGGDRQLFMEVNEAYKVLGDHENRLLYDRFGPPGLGEIREQLQPNAAPPWRPPSPSPPPSHRPQQGPQAFPPPQTPLVNPLHDDGFHPQSQPHQPLPQQPPPGWGGHHFHFQQQHQHPHHLPHGPQPRPPPRPMHRSFMSSPPPRHPGSLADDDHLFVGSKRRSAERRGEDVVFPLTVELSDLYRGIEQQLRILRTTVCPDCQGRGARKVIHCPDCGGRGQRPAGPQGASQETANPFLGAQAATCMICSGTGTTYFSRDQCSACEGRRIVKEKHEVNILVLPGMSHNDEIICKGSADQTEPDMAPGDLIVVLHQKPHPVFKRHRDHLVLRRTITLAEALTGFCFNVEHVDGRLMRFHSEADLVYRPGDVLVARGLGMPIRGAGPRSGDLFIVLDVEFPKANELTAQQRAELAKLLPCPELPRGYPPGVGELVDVYVEAADIGVSQFIKQHHDMVPSHAGAAEQHGCATQ